MDALVVSSARMVSIYSRRTNAKLKPLPCRQARMNGGTSIASAIQKAGQLLKTVDRAAQPPAAADDGAEAAEQHGPAAGAPEAEEAGPSHVSDAMEEVAGEPAAAPVSHAAAELAASHLG